MNIFNQIMETFTVNQLAEMTQTCGQQLGYDVRVECIENPRVEKEQHYYNPTYQGLTDLGKPHLLTVESMKKIFSVVSENKSNIRRDVILGCKVVADLLSPIS